MLKLSRAIFGVSRRFNSTDLTTVKFDDGIKEITLCHQKTRNALSIAMMQNIIDNISKENNNNSLRIIIISAEGPIFSAGHNLKELTEESGKLKQLQVFDLASKLMNCVIDSPVPIVAKIDGLAAAAGCQLVAQCDLALCTEKSTFSTPGVNFGIFCSTPGVALARTVRKKTALKMLLTGLPITSREALESGLVTSVCKDEKTLDEELKIMTDSIKAKSRSVVELGKRFFYEQMSLEVKKAYEAGGLKMVQNLQMSDGREGIKSFVEKRKPLWSHE
ncbi:unnamed protein product [Brassicogethes aeneus]|uniref:Enoyl-CoA hydratase domain-containing protein 3, mitochondrial n=1 Tax=Brassicogethes aeneus TaxID=1431903 RepID=A0A9P0BIK6_BRAAE|nr:unnamed protein product [Brassicogethes aeneus]